MAYGDECVQLLHAVKCMHLRASLGQEIECILRRRVTKKTNKDVIWNQACFVHKV